MFSTQTSNGLSSGITAGSGTINPAALSSSLSNPAAITTENTPRGIKRSRSPDTYGDLNANELGEDGDSKPRKRGRPIKRGSGVPESPNPPHQMSLPHPPPQTPQSQNAPLPVQPSLTTPTQASPPKSTPTKSVIKALPTVRDHTTDQLGPEGDEYIPREYDENGEKKVSATGLLSDGREYKCRTFFVPNRGDKLFMLATECARVLGYRDSYLLFNKNRSLYKIIATQAEKEDLIHQEILPFSYRSRQIAIVTAKSMFRQFGSRVIVDGRRVRDDYWEQKARKQGFTEEDMAGEKRPGAAKARDAAAAEASASLALGHHGDIVYSNSPAHFGAHPQPQTVQPGMIGAAGGGGGSGAATLPMITLAPEQGDMRLRDYSNIQRPRQEITGPAYQDRTQPSPATELLTHAHHTAEYNKQLNTQRDRSNEFLQRHWRTPHEVPPPTVASQPMGTHEGLPATQSLQSPRALPGSLASAGMSSHGAPPLQHLQYTQPPHQQNPVAQSPMRSMPQTALRPDQMGRSPGMSLGSSSLQGGGGNPYGYAQPTQMWPQPGSQPTHNYPAYSPQQPSPHIQPSPHQSSHSLPPQQQQPPPPQLRHQGSSSAHPGGANPSGAHASHPGHMQQPQQATPSMQYPGMQGLGQPYPSPARGLYQQDPLGQQYMSSGGPQAGNAQGWAPQQPPGGGGNWGWTGQPQ